MRPTIKQRRALRRAMNAPIPTLAKEARCIDPTPYVYRDETRTAFGLHPDARPDLLMTAGRIAGAWRALKRAVWRFCFEPMED